MTKEEQYAALLPQVKALCEGETDIIAKMANVSALLHQEFGFWWTGFYRVTEYLSNKVTEPLGSFFSQSLCHSATQSLSNSQKATLAAAATLSESTPRCIGIFAT